MVFDGSWGPEYSDIYNECNSRGAQGPYPRIVGRNACVSEYLNLNAGDEIRIVVAEVPGGRMGGGLFIEEKGVENPGLKDDGKYRLIPFSTDDLTEEDVKLLSEKQLPIETKKVPAFYMKK